MENIYPQMGKTKQERNKANRLELNPRSKHANKKLIRRRLKEKNRRAVNAKKF